MSAPVEELYCGDCGERMYVERIPARNAGGSTQWINGRIHCVTPGCLVQSSPVDVNGDPVDV